MEVMILKRLDFITTISANIGNFWKRLLKIFAYWEIKKKIKLPFSAK